jgi:hypothetical protein
LFGTNFDNDSTEPERVKIYGCADPDCSYELSEDEYHNQKEMGNFLGNPFSLTSTTINTPKYDFFISYYSGTGYTYARYLKDHAQDIGNLNAFLDKDDIPKKILTDSDEFQRFIDKAIENSDYLVLLMTRRFNQRRQVIHEFKTALDFGIPILLFKEKSLRNTELSSSIGESIDFSLMEYTEFIDSCDLLTKLDILINNEN